MPVILGEVVVVGGGCYGTFYSGQLLRARERGAATWHRLTVVDRDRYCRAARELGAAPGLELVVAEWDRFFDRWLSSPRVSDPCDAIVPSPLRPHHMFDWLVRRARARWPGRPIEQRPVPLGPGTPYDVLAPDGTRYVSYADWLCPTHCIEPATCPVIGAPRTWELSEAMERLRRRLERQQPTAGPVLFVCRHVVYGVGMFSAASVLAGDALVASAGDGERSTDVLVATVSACHGAAGLLHLG